MRRWKRQYDGGRETLAKAGVEENSNVTRLSDWLDKQVSKAVLGQTATTDAETGGLGSGKEHREVQEDIERADCKALAAVLNRDLVQPWVILERGPQARYPQIVISRPEAEDLKAFSAAIGGLIDRGLTGDAGQLARREHARLQRWAGAWLDDFEAAWLELTADARRSTLARRAARACIARPHRLGA